METKKWYQSKTIWAGAIAVLVALYNSAQAALSGQCGVEGSFCINLPLIPDWIFGILGALGIYGRAGATTAIK